MRAIPTLKISISGVRGVVGESLTPTLLTRFAQAFGTYVGHGAIVIGRDTRTSGEMVRQAVVAGLLSSGCRVVDLDVCPVPTVQLLVRQRGARGGIAITASHNPAEWNALKFVNSAGLFLTAAQARQLLDIYHQGEYVKVPGAEMRSVEASPGAIDLHVKAIMDALGPLPAGGRRLRAVVDSCNGAGSVVAPRLLEALGAEVVQINTTPDGLFPRGAEPVPENLGALRDAVREHDADVGFAQDMDADRLAVVDERGAAIGEEYTLVLAARHVLAKEPGPVVANLATTQVLDSVARGFGCPIYRSKIGEANVTEEMQRRGAVVGGEGNGGVIYPRINFARDSLVGMALVLHLLAATGRTVSELVGELPRSFMFKEKLVCRSDRIGRVLKRVRDVYARRPQDLRDGVKVTMPDGWLLVRGSNTEPIIRLVAEGETEAGARAMIADLRACVEDCLAERS
ncbi:MAG TPA: phosphoglucosamine mutase [Pyrinomonadaceae bacterium]|jgi:phosphomannomutase|nr:phosphoglucosamine mutase [Pyrinomonadaceae bacterium]